MQAKSKKKKYINGSCCCCLLPCSVYSFRICHAPLCVITVKAHNSAHCTNCANFYLIMHMSCLLCRCVCAHTAYTHCTPHTRLLYVYAVNVRSTCNCILVELEPVLRTNILNIVFGNSASHSHTHHTHKQHMRMYGEAKNNNKKITKNK